jgi:hypothetical protein
MLIEYDRFSVASHWVSAIEYGDCSGLEDKEEKELDDFLASLPPGYKVWQWSEDTQFSKDEVSGFMSDCLEAVLFVESSQV